MNLSLGEMQDLARKACRGAGYSWGEAEEAGHAMRWLARHGMPGADALVALLKRKEQALPDQECPIKIGCQMIDGHHSPGLDAAPQGAIQSPLLLLPFVAWTAADTGKTLSLRAGTAVAICPAEGPIQAKDTEAWPMQARVKITAEPAASPGSVTLKTRAILSDHSMELLLAFAHRTYAPATEESRKRGAGGADDP